MMKMPFYTNLKGRMVIYWLSNIGVSLQFCETFNRYPNNAFRVVPVL